MSLIFWILLATLVSGFGAYIFWVRTVKKPRSSKMYSEQQHIDKKAGEAGYKAQSSSAESLLGRMIYRTGWRTLMTICLFMLAVSLLIWFLRGEHTTVWPSLEAPSLETVGNWVRRYWLWLLIPLAVAYVTFSLKKNDVLQKAVMAIGAGFLVAAVVFGGGTPHPSRQVARTDSAVSPEAVIPSTMSPYMEWSQLTIPAGEGKRSELVSAPIGKKLVMHGFNYRNHTVYTNGVDCPFNEKIPCPDGAVVGYYAENLGSEQNSVLYAFAPIR